MKWKTKRVFFIITLLVLIIPFGTQSASSITVESGVQFRTKTRDPYFLDNCDDSTGWTNLTAQTMTFSTDTTNEIEGSGCVQTVVEFGAGGTAAFRGNNGSALDISDKDYIYWWIRTNDTIGNIFFVLYDSNLDYMYWNYPDSVSHADFTEYILDISNPTLEQANFTKSDIDFVMFQCVGVGNITIWNDYIYAPCDVTWTTDTEFDFYKVELNNSHLWLDKSYTTKRYTRYCIYMISSYVSTFSIDSWFASANGTAQITINTPSSTTFNLGFYSPNLISASATGVVSYSWDASTQILSMTANTDTDTVITISATVNETSTNGSPENYDVSITDMEGCGNWVFSEESYYTFQAQYWDGDGHADLDTMKLRFSDGVANVTAVYNQPDDEWTLETGEDIVNLRAGTATVLDSNLLQVTFLIYFENTVLDALDIDISMWCSDIENEIDPWEVMAADYFNIYSLGGHSTIEVSGDAGRLAGGDVFELYANRSSWVEANTTFRNLQHIKLLPQICYEQTGDYYNVTYSIDYCTDEEDWIDGWDLRLCYTRTYISGVKQYTQFRAEWYDKGELVKNENFSTYFHGWVVGNSSLRLWVDLWFNRINASSTWGGRVNAYYFPMTDSSTAWLRWLTGSNWGIDDTMSKESMCFGTIKDSDDNVLYASNIKLVRVSTRIDVANEGGTPIQWVQLQNYDVFDLSFSPFSRQFEGIQTPVFDETKVPVMPQGGFLGAIVSGLARLGAYLSAALGPSLLSFWNAFVGFMDTIFAWLGYPNAFSLFIGWLQNLWGWLGTSFTWLVSALTSMFTLLGSFLGKLLNTISTVVAQWVSVIQMMFAFLDGTYTSGVHIWNDLGLATWVVLLAILYPVYLLTVWDEQGIDRVYGHIKMMVDVASFIINFFIRIIQLTLNVIGRIIESIPVVE